MWDLPRPGLEPVSPALAGGFSTTAPPGKPLIIDFLKMGLSGSLQCRYLFLVRQTKASFMAVIAGLPLADHLAS